MKQTNSLLKPICWLATLWNEIKNPFSYSVSGHEYDLKDSEFYFDKIVEVDYCSRCGEPTISFMSQTQYEQMKAEGQI